MMGRGDNILHSKVDALTDRLVKMVVYLRKKGAEKAYLDQVARSGTSIGANVYESKNAQSRADFVNKLSIALKEADETTFWLSKFHVIGELTDEEFNSINSDTKEIIYLLTAIIKKTKENGL